MVITLIFPISQNDLTSLFYSNIRYLTVDSILLSEQGIRSGWSYFLW